MWTDIVPKFKYRHLQKKIYKIDILKICKSLKRHSLKCVLKFCFCFEAAGLFNLDFWWWFHYYQLTWVWPMWILNTESEKGLKQQIQVKRKKSQPARKVLRSQQESPTRATVTGLLLPFALQCQNYQASRCCCGIHSCDKCGKRFATEHESNSVQILSPFGLSC